MTRIAAPTVRILVCGNADRGDDGAALAAVAGLLPTLSRDVLDHVEVRRRDQLSPDDLVELPDGMAALVVDTAVGVAPGETVVLPLAVVAGQPAGAAPRSSHALPPDVTLRLAAAVRGSLPPGTFVGIGGRSFAFGRHLSKPVRAGLAAFRRALADELIRLAGPVAAA